MWTSVFDFKLSVLGGEARTALSSIMKIAEYRRRSQQPNTRWKALEEIYNFHILLVTLIFKNSHVKHLQ